MNRDQFTFYRSYWEAVKRLRRKEDRLSALEAIAAYALDGETRPMTDVADGLFILIRPTLDAAARKSEGSRRKQAGKQQDTGKISARPAEDTANKKEKEKEVEREIEKESYTSPSDEGEERAPPRAPRPQRKKYGAYGWVRLTPAEYDHLTADLGADELARCIRTVDELAQQNGNKYKWRDWNLVLRKCHRESWGRSGKDPRTYAAAVVPGPENDKTLDRLERLRRRMHEEDPT